MKIINTDKILPTSLNASEREYVYNGLDCCITAEVLDVLLPQLDDITASTYGFSRALQGPCLEMRLRGVRVDARRKAEVIEEFSSRLDHLDGNLERIVAEGVGVHGFSWRSPAQIKDVLYDRLGIPPVRKFGKPTSNREALERLEGYLIGRQICKHIMALRDLAGKIKTLRTAVDPDGRLRTSYNIGGTSTGRFSSSFSEFGTGGNLQNVEESLRSIFIADKGMKIAKCDTKQGESFCVGGIIWNLFKDSKYLDACESGDIHTATARVCWPSLAWTGDLKQDKAIAEQPYYRHYSYRFMCKKLGHGSNYLGQPDALAAQTKTEVELVEDFQPKYFKAYPGIKRWHSAYKILLETQGFLTTLTGRRRFFMGRRTESDILREAMAFDPQGSLADIVNSGMLNVWHHRDVTLYMHDHDAITVQYPEEMEDEVIPKLMAQLPQRIELQHGRELVIPYDCKVGWNKADFNAETNPDGLKDYVSGDQRKRTEEVSIMDRRVRDVYRQSRVG